MMYYMLASCTSPRATEIAPKAHRGAAFSVDGLRFGYRPEQDIFRDFRLKARPGELLALVGPSGCGKTTLLNLLSGFLAPNLAR
jgi:NitT/TauT family transport system ATP-binding protein